MPGTQEWPKSIGGGVKAQTQSMRRVKFIKCASVWKPVPTLYEKHNARAVILDTCSLFGPPFCSHSVAVIASEASQPYTAPEPLRAEDGLKTVDHNT